MLEVMYREFPRTKGKVVYSELSTPLTMHHYSGHTSFYGLAKTPSYFGPENPIQPKVAEVPGLYVTGQDTLLAGFWGVLMSGMITASSALGYGFIDTMAFKRYILSDVANTIKREMPQNGDDEDRAGVGDSGTKVQKSLVAEKKVANVSSLIPGAKVNQQADVVDISEKYADNGQPKQATQPVISGKVKTL